MKIIKIKDCIDCPSMSWNAGIGENYCWEADLELPEDIPIGYIHPDCPLEDYKEQEEKDYDYWKASVERYNTEISQGKLF